MKKIIIVLSVASLLILSCCKTKGACRYLADTDVQKEQVTLSVN